MLHRQIKSLAPYINIRNLIILGLFSLPMVLVLMVFFSNENDNLDQPGTTTYLYGPNQARCPSGSRSGEAGSINGESSTDGIKYNVRTPLNYDPTFAHPLLMVYAPSGANRARTEKLTGLTFEATTAGFIVAYADHPELSPTTTIQLGAIPGLIAKKWCIDQNRIYLTGHSDGGTVSMALAFMAGTKHIPSAIAPSAAGINYGDLRDHSCPSPISVMIMHSAKDRLFPGYGEQSSGWWAACNDCGPIPEKMANGCIAYTDCADNTKTWYCEGEKPHSKWPAINSTLIEFFTSLKPRSTSITRGK